MTLHDGLLAHAHATIPKSPGRPGQAVLRRGISTGYYALFHLLTFEAGRMLISGSDAAWIPLRGRVRRAFEHSTMNTVCKGFAAGQPAKPISQLLPAPVNNAPAVSVALQHVAKAFVDLQTLRHQADYDAVRSFTLRDAQLAVADVDAAFDAWGHVPEVEKRVFLTALLLGKSWER